MSLCLTALVKAALVNGVEVVLCQKSVQVRARLQAPKTYDVRQKFLPETCAFSTDLLHGMVGVFKVLICYQPAVCF